MSTKFGLEDLLFCLEMASQVSEAYDQYVLHPEGRPRSVDDMLWVCSEYLGKKISVFELDLAAEGRSVKAACFANEDGSFEIGVLSGLEEDELRFVLCKEIFHAMLERIECRNLNLYDHVASSIEAVVERLPNRAAEAEQLALIAAMEFLFPFATREAILGRTTGELDYAEMASRYNVPLRFVEEVFEDDNVELLRQVMPLIARDSPARPFII